MFRPYKVILRPSKKTDPIAVYDQLLDLFFRRPEDDLTYLLHGAESFLRR